jgi:acyl carrier protein
VSDHAVDPDPNVILRRETMPLLGPYVAPRTPTERKLAAIWQHALGIDRIGILDDYNHLGQDSLLAAGIFVEIEDAFGFAIPMGVLVDAPTIEQLAQKLDELSANTGP